MRRLSIVAGGIGTAIGRNLYPRVPDMRRPQTQELTDGELFYIIENGVRLTGMPAWGGPETAEGTLNPKSPDEWRALDGEEAFLRGDAPEPREPGHAAHSH